VTKTHIGSERVRERVSEMGRGSDRESEKKGEIQSER